MAGDASSIVPDPLGSSSQHLDLVRVIVFSLFDDPIIRQLMATACHSEIASVLQSLDSLSRAPRKDVQLKRSAVTCLINPLSSEEHALSDPTGRSVLRITEHLGSESQARERALTSNSKTILSAAPVTSLSSTTVQRWHGRSSNTSRMMELQNHHTYELIPRATLLLRRWWTKASTLT